MSKRKANNSGAHASKRRPNFTGPEMEVLFQGVESKRDILFSPVSAGYNSSKKKEAWEDITGDINTVSGEGRTAAEVKKKWADVKSEAKKRISKHRRDMLATGDGTADPGLSERDQRVEAIMEAKPVDGVPGAENMDTDQGYHLSSAAVAPSPILSPPLIKREIETDDETDDSEAEPAQPSTSAAPPARPSISAATRAPRARGDIITQAVLDSQLRIADSQERIAGALEALAATMAKMNDTLTQINKKMP